MDNLTNLGGDPVRYVCRAVVADTLPLNEPTVRRGVIVLFRSGLNSEV